VIHKNKLKDLYEPHFKHIFFYSDLPVQEDNEVIYIDTQHGFYTQRIFKQFYDNFKHLIDHCDGLFYTMDDNIINLNILNLYRNDKILFFCEPFNASNTFNYPPADIENQHTWHWEFPYGKETIRKMLQNDQFKKYNITKFSGAISDWFYLPKKYLTPTLFELFDHFRNVFFEIAIATIIHNISYDKRDYQPFTDTFLMGSSREQVANTDYVYDIYNHKFDLVIHPIKYNLYPVYTEFLPELFAKEKCIVIYTTEQPTTEINQYCTSKEYDVIIVGDLETPDIYKQLRCIFLDVDSQYKLFSEELSKTVENKKTLGYLFAAKRGYKIICDALHTNIITDVWNTIANKKIIELYKC
jgi:hypothetical protein